MPTWNRCTVSRYDASALVDSEVRKRAEQLQATPLLFGRGTTVFEPGGDEILAAHVENVRVLDTLAQAAGTRFRLEITGHADTDGTPTTNDLLSSQRADRVRSSLAQIGLRHIELSAAGVGSSQPLRSSPVTAADQQANRRVSLRLVPLGTPPGR